jgi:hypothetical protein
MGESGAGEWTACCTEEGHWYYFNSITGVSQWEPPVGVGDVAAVDAYGYEPSAYSGYGHMVWEGEESGSAALASPSRAARQWAEMHDDEEVDREDDESAFQDVMLPGDMDDGEEGADYASPRYQDPLTPRQAAAPGMWESPRAARPGHVDEIVDGRRHAAMLDEGAATPTAPAARTPYAAYPVEGGEEAVEQEAAGGMVEGAASSARAAASTFQASTVETEGKQEGKGRRRMAVLDRFFANAIKGAETKAVAEPVQPPQQEQQFSGAGESETVLATPCVQ